MTALEHLNNLAAHLLAPEEEGGKKYTYTEIANMWHEIRKGILERDMYYKALCDIEQGKDIRMILERVLT